MTQPDEYQSLVHFSQPLNHAILSLLLLRLLLYWCFSGKSLCMYSEPDIYLSIWYFTVIILSKIFSCNMIQFKFSSVLWQSLLFGEIKQKKWLHMLDVLNKRHAVLDEPLLPPIHNLQYIVYCKLWRIWCSNKCFCEPPGNSLQCSYPLTLFCNLERIITTQACALSVGKATALGVIWIGGVSE